MNNKINPEAKPAVKNKKENVFYKFLRAAFVENWELKFIALAFAVAVWIIFKIS